MNSTGSDSKSAASAWLRHRVGNTTCTRENKGPRMITVTQVNDEGESRERERRV